MRGPKNVRRRLLVFALGFPEAWEDHPWDSDVAKVNKKVFVFFGHEDAEEPGMAVKLRDSHDQAMSTAGTSPTAYGLGKSGWVSISFSEAHMTVGVLEDWIEESYRTIAPRRLVALLDRADRKPP